MRPCPESAVPFLVTSGKSQNQKMVMPRAPSEIIFPFVHFRDEEPLRGHSNGLRSQTEAVSEPEIKCPDQYTSYECLCPSSISLDHRFFSHVKQGPVTSTSQYNFKDQMQSWIENSSKKVEVLGFQETLESQEWHRLPSHI